MLTTRCVPRARCKALGMIWFSFWFSFSSAICAGQNITLAWDSSGDPSVVGYVVYYGTASQNYTTRIDVGTNLTATVTNLQPGLTYYFAITDYNTNHVESAPSSEISNLLPVILQMATGTNSSGSFQSLSFPVAPSHWYEVQGSTNLQSWTTLWQTPVATSNAWVQFTDPQRSTLPRRFYRLVLH